MAEQHSSGGEQLLEVSESLASIHKRVGHGSWMRIYCFCSYWKHGSLCCIFQICQRNPDHVSPWTVRAWATIICPRGKMNLPWHMRILKIFRTEYCWRIFSVTFRIFTSCFSFLLSPKQGNTTYHDKLLTRMWVRKTAQKHLTGVAWSQENVKSNQTATTTKPGFLVKALTDVWDQ